MPAGAEAQRRRHLRHGARELLLLLLLIIIMIIMIVINNTNKALENFVEMRDKSGDTRFQALKKVSLSLYIYIYIVYYIIL